MVLNFIFGSEKRFFDFISNISEKDMVGIVSHTDCDGISAALIISKVIGKLESLQLISYDFGAIDKAIEELKNKKINKVIFADLFIDNAERVKKMEKFAEILFIDHHPSENDFNSEKTIYLKAESEYPASYLCYYLFSKIQKIPSWIAAVGITFDMPNKYNKDNCEQVYKDFGLEKSQGNLWRAYEDVAFALAAFRNDEKKIYNLLLDVQLLDNINFDRYTMGIKKEFEEKLREFEKEKEVYKDIIFYYMHSKYSIKSLLINKLSSEYPDKTLIFISSKDGKSKMLNVSSRRQDRKVDCNLLIKEITKTLPNSMGGGHKAAAGALIPREYLNKFKDELIRVYKKFENYS